MEAGMGMVSGAATDLEPILITVKGDADAAHAGTAVGLDLSRFHNGRWALQLDAIFARRTDPAIILARGVVCLAVAWWAQLSPRSYLQAIRGALFVSPLRIDFGQAAIATSALAGPHCRLPFPTIVISDAGAPYLEQVLSLADDWGSTFLDTGAAHSTRPSNRRPATSDFDAMLPDYLELLDDAARVGTQTPQSDVAHAGFGGLRR
jgi:hypothetical protein